ncbi:hypothetical protein KKG72_00275 [bacterium]|nr:hypothetical protein [bacterium]MBU1993280.1 hypothetical protein [bacterium]
MKFLLIFSLFVCQLFSAQAYGKLREFQNADGTTFKAKACGNQHLNWLQTQDGEIVKHNPKSRNFEYAHIKNNTLEASGERYEKNNSKRSKTLKDAKKLNNEEVYKLWNEKQRGAHKRKDDLNN